MSARDDVAFLVGSEYRLQTLRALRNDSLRPSALASRLSCARETAQRNLAGFVERNWVDKTGNTYYLTVAGRMVLDRYDRLENTVASADKLTVFLTHVGDALGTVDPSLLADQTVTSSTPANPHGPINRWLDLIGTSPAEEYRGIAPIVSRVFNEGAEEIIGPDSDIELVIDESVLKTSREQYPEALELALDLEQFTLLLYPSELEFGLTICDGRVWLGAYDEYGNIVASVDGDDDAFVTWARETYETHRESCQVVESEMVLS